MKNIKNNVDLEWNVFVTDINKRKIKVFIEWLELFALSFGSIFFMFMYWLVFGY